MNERIAVIMRSMNEQPHTRRAVEGLFEQQAGGFELYNVDCGYGLRSMYRGGCSTA